MDPPLSTHRQGSAAETRQHLRSFRLRRTLTLCCYVMQSVVHGISFYIYPPILAAYLTDIHSKHIALYEGLIFALEPIVGSVAAIFLGRLCDKTRQAKMILIVLQLSQVVGNMLYSVRITEWTIVIGKVFCGLGEEAFFAVATGELATFYYGKAEAWALLLLTMGFAIGMAIGPLLNFPFIGIAFSFGRFEFNTYNTPGLMVAGLHFIMAIVCALTIFDMTALTKQYRILRDTAGSAVTFSSSESDSDNASKEVRSSNVFQSRGATTWQVVKHLMRRRPIGPLIVMSFLFMTLAMISMTVIPLAGLTILNVTTSDLVVAFSLAGTMSVVGNFFVYRLPMNFRMGHVLVLTMIIFVFQTACIMLVSFDVVLGATSRAVFFIWAGLHGLSFIFADLICRTIVAILTPRGHRSLAEGVRQVAVCSGYFIGGALGGTLFELPVVLGLVSVAIITMTVILFIVEHRIILAL